jgi:hypothetical protein
MHWFCLKAVKTNDVCISWEQKNNTILQIWRAKWREPVDQRSSVVISDVCLDILEVCSLYSFSEMLEASFATVLCYWAGKDKASPRNATCDFIIAVAETKRTFYHNSYSERRDRLEIWRRGSIHLKGSLLLINFLKGPLTCVTVDAVFKETESETIPAASSFQYRLLFSE